MACEISKVPFLVEGTADIMIWYISDVAVEGGPLLWVVSNALTYVYIIWHIMYIQYISSLVFAKGMFVSDSNIDFFLPKKFDVRKMKRDVYQVWNACSLCLF